MLDTLAAALGAFVPGVQCRGTSDLALGGRKFSGNSARCRRNHLLYHGTLLYNFPLELIERCLAMPPRMPDYREGRPHEQLRHELAVDGRKPSERRWSMPSVPTKRASLGRIAAPRSLWPRSTACREWRAS